VKQKIKNLIIQFIASLSPIEKEIPIQDLSIFFSVLIAIFTLRTNKRRQLKHSNFYADFSDEIHIINQKFPELLNVFSVTEKKLRDELLSAIFIKLQEAFEAIDSDVDDIISWSYQFLKKDYEKSAFRKTGKDNIKIEGIDLLFTTQFFTDKYMVKYLVDKSICEVQKKTIQNVVIIDCACGGGNFLNYSFEKLYLIYKKNFPTWSTQEIVDTILNEAIIGYDLDNNLSKISSISLFVKASSYAIPSENTHIRIYGGLSNDKLGFLNNNVSSNEIGNTTFKSRLNEIDKEKKVKVFVTNPPFMGKRDMDISLKNFLLKTFPESKGDLCVSFLQRIIQSMNEKDVLGIVSQNNWLYLSSLKDFRKLFLSKQTLRECVDLGSNAFEDINGEKTNVALCIIGNSKSTTFFNLKNCSTSEKKDLVSSGKFPVELTFKLTSKQFLKNVEMELNYQLEDRFKNIRQLKLYAEFGNPMQGTSTGNNNEFVKYAWEVNGSPDWVLVSKGGGFSKWVGLNYYKVKWGVNAEKIKANKGSALRNLDKISSTQLVYSDTGTLGMNVRVLKENQVFIASGPGIQVVKGDKYAHLAFLNSRIATFLVKLINPKFTISAGYISKIPVAENILDSKFISVRSKMCLDLKEKYLQNKLPNFEFEHLDYSMIKDVNGYIEDLILFDIINDFQRLKLEFEIESEIKKCYQFDLNELAEVKSVVGESPFFNKNKLLKIENQELDLLIVGNINLNCLTTSRAINGYSVGSESLLENLSYKLDVNPEILLNFIRENISCFNLTKIKYFNDLLHKIILKELGVEKISVYKYNVIKTEYLIEHLKINYPFLKKQLNLSEMVYSILQQHHKTSFLNKPLIYFSKDFLTIGRVYNG